MAKKYGLHIRDNSGYWHYDFSIRKKRYRGSTKTTDYNLAEQYAHKTYSDIYLEKHEIKAPEPKSIKVTDYLQMYLKALQYKASRHHAYSVERTLIKFVDFLISNKIQHLHEITVQILEQYKIKELQEVKKITVANKIRRVKAFLSYAVRLELIKDNPAKKLERINGILINKIRFFSHEEIEKIIRAFDDTQYRRFAYMKDFVNVALHTGMRRSELINLEYEDVDLERRQIYIRNKEDKDFTTKSYKERIVPLHNNLIPFFSQSKKGFCFLHKGEKYNPKTATKNFSIMLKRLEINGEAGLHTLRHTFASYLVMSNVDMRTVSEYLGHSTTHVTELYSHLCQKHFNSEIQKLDF